MQQPEVHAGVYFHTNLDELKKAFFKKFTLVQAAGGYVINENNELLLIFRRGKWDLPKGKLDKGETLEQCAVREVKEETGLNDVNLTHPLLTTYHTYHEGSRYMLKESHWYHMKAKGNQLLIPQKEENIEKIIWAKKGELSQFLPQSFPSISDVINTVVNS
jgi:8-oxo-dGTP pyrophosphatase MutT (NUDIX family)